MKISKKLLPVLISAVILFSFAAPVLAAENDSGKEEVVYVTTDASGTVERIDVVNIFGGGTVTDYGEYSAVKMLNTDDEIRQNGDTVTFTSDADRVYYQGTMKNNEIPWKISILYFLDGQEYGASELAGKSGHLEVRFAVAENEEATGDFYDNYALQASFLLDAYRCSNLSAPDATIADVGSDKQLTYTILPGKGIDTVFSADVKDFEMDAATINGVKLKLNVTVDDAEMMDQIGDLIDGIADIDNGADSLYDGAADLQDGGGSLVDGASSLNSGIAALDIGLEKLKAGIGSAQSGLETLNAKSDTLVEGSAQVKTALETIDDSLSSVSVSTDQLTALTQASGAIKTGIGALYDGAAELSGNLGYAQYKAAMTAGGLDIDALKAGNAQAISDLNAQIGELQAQAASLEAAGGSAEQIASLKAQAGQLQTVVSLLSGNNAAIGGTESYLGSVSDAMGQVEGGLDDLNTQYGTFDASIGELADTLTGMMTDLSTLSSGIGQLVTKYTELDGGIGDYTDGVAALVSGYSTIMDGVSDLAEGSGELADGSGNLYSGTVGLYDGIRSLCDGSKDLADGTGEMRSETSDMDGEVQDKIDDMIDSIQGDDAETLSFTSTKNTSVHAVQFVIRTASIEKSEETAAKIEEDKDTTFWDKLLKLFGWD